jgi:Galactose oxidase, central domain
VKTSRAVLARWSQLLILALTLSSCGGGGGGSGGATCPNTCPPVPQPGPPVISLAAPRGATLNQPYTFTFTATQGTLPITFSASGALPPGLNSVTSAGVLAGTPTAIGTFPIVVRAVNGVGQSVTQNFVVHVFQHGFRLTGTTLHPRGYHTASLLATGHVLVTGGFDGSSPNDAPTASAESFDPTPQTFTATGSMEVGRVFHTATLLCDLSAITCSDPRVLIAGGESGGAQPGLTSMLQTAELYDPVTGTFTSTGDLLASRTRHTATLLGNGKVLIAGGSTLVQLSPASLAAVAELFDPGTGTFTATGSLNTPRDFHTATLLQNGKVLIAGGLDTNNTYIGQAELYDPATGTFTATGNMVDPRHLHTATLLSSGKVLIVGGEGANTFVAPPEIYDPDTGTFTTTGTLVTPQWLPALAVLLPDGTVLVAGGSALDPSNPTSNLPPPTANYAELFDPTTGTFSETGGLQIEAGGGFVMTALGKSSNAVALVTGDVGAAQLYQ